MGIGDALSGAFEKSKELFEGSKDKIDDVLHSEQVEQVSDNVLNGAADLAKKVAPAAGEQIDGVRDDIDKAVGNE
ncbi:hypothetical protein [Leucobacter iarius]|uniref:Antitoxin n=1 Tax=Leucobacter iarius TaxID=333963 RepID=A0ABN2LPK3_9MICO